MENRTNFFGRIALVPAVLAALAASCGESLAERVDVLIDEFDRMNSLYCDCYEQYGFEDRVECELDDAVLPAERRCIAEAFARDESASMEYIDCLLPLRREFNACLDSRLECESEDSDEACYDDMSVGFETCGDLPPAVSRALDEC